MKGSFSVTAGLRRLVIGVSLLAIMLAGTAVSRAQRTEYRGFWVDTFNTNLNNAAQVSAAVAAAKSAGANALFVQVRRRGDSWYLNTIEPVTTEVPIEPGFDPLQDIITKAHGEGMEVHAFVIMSAIWSRSPALFRPANPNHPFNLHGGYDPATNTITPGPNNWLTRTLIPDGTAGIAFQGHRFVSDFWVDFGHPDAAKYTVDVVTHLVQNYDIDGLHLDRIRYPEIGVTGQTPSTGTSVGYNTTSVERFQRHYGLPVDSPPPAINDANWSQWRRDQVTNVVRRTYLSALAAKPNLKVSAALIAFGNGPTTEASWNNAEARWRVYQDWRAWTEEGIIDIAIPMNYKTEHTTAGVTGFNSWDTWLRGHLYNRAGMMGTAPYLNAIEGTLRQTRRTLTPASGPDNLSGILYFSLANVNVAVAANPFRLPTAGATPIRSFAEFASGLKTGASIDGLTRYEPEGLTPIFSQPAQIPTFSWKTAPTKGHIMGFARPSDAAILDTKPVTIKNLDTNAERTAVTDGGGFFGAVDLEPGRYLVTAVNGGDTLYSCQANVTAGHVASADVAIENTAPVTTAVITPSANANGWHNTDVQVELSTADSCTGVASAEYSLDGGATWLPQPETLTITEEGIHEVLYRSTDLAGNSATGSTTVRIDRTAPVAAITVTPDTIWPVNGKLADVTVSGTGSDELSGLSLVTYTIVDEYGEVFSIPAHLLNNSTTWIDIVKLKASRRGNDRNGRLYVITATISDAAGNSVSSSAEVVVVHDQRN